MAYGIIRVQKVKRAAVGAMQYHNDRVPGEHSNEDIDPSRTLENVEMVEHGSYRAEVADRIERFRDSERAVRKDAVVLCEGIVTASPEFFEGLSAEEVKEFFEDAFRFTRSEAGAENMIHFTVHMDETTPHAHFGFTPIKDGALSWKKFFDGKYAMRAYQDRFYEQVGKKWGLERGEKSEDTSRRHKTTQQMKRDNRRELRELETAVEQKQQQSAELTNQIADRQGDLVELDSAIEDKQLVLQDLGQQVQQEQRRLEEVRRAVEEAQLEPAPQTLGESARALWAARNDGAREEVLAGEVEGLRSRISELERANQGARERVAELDRGLPGLRGRYQQLEQRFEVVERRVTQAIERLREVPETVSAWAQDIARKLGKRVYDPRSLDYLAREAREAARASSIDRGARPQRRGWDAR